MVSLFPFPDGERLVEVTDPGRQLAGAHAASLHRKADDSSESREDEQMVILFMLSLLLSLVFC